MKKITLLLCLTVPLISVSQALKDENNSELNFYGNEFKLPEDDNFSNEIKSSLKTLEISSSL